MDEELYLGCESVAEQNLLNALLKNYRTNDIQSQVEIGPYRVDFLTGRVAWEVDGKDYHEYRRDKARDTWILNNSFVEQIIRIPAGALHHFRDPCLAIFSHYVTGFNHPAKDACMDVAESLRQADLYCRQFDEFGFCDEIGQFGELEAYDARCSGIGYVGSPLAFLDGHPIWQHVAPRDEGRHRWKGRIFNRTLPRIS